MSLVIKHFVHSLRFCKSFVCKNCFQAKHQQVRIIGGAIGNGLQKYWGASVEFWVLASPSEAAKEDSVLAVCIAVWTLAVWTVKIL